MSDNIDDWLNSLGLSNTPSQEVTSHPSREVTSPQETLPSVPEAVQYTEAEPQSQPFSTDDFNDILADNGFQEPEYEEAEEVVEEEEEEEEDNTDAYDENQGEGRDLDAEEDNNLEEAIAMASRIVAPVEFDPASVVDQEVHFHMPNGDVVDVPIVNEDLHEVEARAIEAFEAVQQAAVVTEATPASEPVIPLNSPTLLLNDSTSRFSGTEWYSEIQKSRIILAGCGGIGSWTILQLARMNPAALFMYDDDIVEVANMSGQLYCQEDVGKYKVDAMADMVRSYTTMRNIFAIKSKFTQQSEAGDIMICGFDNMAARNTFFHAWRKHLREIPEEQKYKCVYLDGRLSIDTLQVFCITGDNDWAINEYMEKYLFSDAQADATQCSLKQTSYLACMIGSVIVNLFTNFIANTLNPVIPYDLPFFTEYDAQNMIFKTLK